MSEKGGFREGLEAGRRAAQQPVAVRRRRQSGPDGEPRRERRDRPPLAAFAVMAVSIVLILYSDNIQRALGMTGNLPEILGIFISAIGVMMLRPPRRK